MKRKSDEELMQEFAAGNVEAFKEIWLRHGQKLYNLFRRSLGNPGLAEDLLQECFMRVIQARHRYQSRQAFSSWLITIAMNLLRDKYRQKGRRGAYLDSESTQTLDQLPESDGEPHQILEKTQMKEAVEKALLELPVDQRKVIILSKYHGLSFAEIGKILQLSPAAAKQKAYRGMQTLRKKLAYLKEE